MQTFTEAEVLKLEKLYEAAKAVVENKDTLIVPISLTDQMQKLERAVRGAQEVLI